jgi:hypothetical protein
LRIALSQFTPKVGSCFKLKSAVLRPFNIPKTMRAGDLMEWRLTLAKRFGARCALRGDLHAYADQVLQVVGKRGLDAAVLTVPSDDALFQDPES